MQIIVRSNQIFIYFTKKGYDSRKKGIILGATNIKYQRGASMSRILTFFEVMEIRELLSLKITSLSKSKLFFTTMKDHHHAGCLEADINLCIQEITDLENVLNCSAV